MDRDRERGRDRGDRRDDRYSNTYRPRSPGPRAESYRARSPPPPASRPRGVLAADTYTPGGGRASRPRSRSPAFRRRSRSPRRDDGDSWRSRARSPPRRAAYSPRRDDYRASDRGRSPRRGGYDSYARSPAAPRDRSPFPRGRDVSPARSRGMRSPPRVRRESPPRSRYEEPRSRAHSPYRRPYSPPRDERNFRRRSPSPRRDRVDPYTADTWRRPSSRSPGRQQYGSNDVSGRQSAASSRRSSPPVHPSRAALAPDLATARESVSAPRSPYREQDDRDRDYGRERDIPVRPRETPPTGPRSEREYAGAPTGPSSFRHHNGDGFARAPPTGPSTRGYPSPAISPPVGGMGLPHHTPAFPRSSNPALSAPTRPRGGARGGFGGESYRDFAGPPRRGSWGAGARGGFYGGPSPGMRGGGNFAPPFRGSSNSTSTTYPRTMRFTNHLADLPKEIPGGQKAPELYDKSKIAKLEEEARRLREVIEQKETMKRKTMREWENLEREASNASLKSELAEQQLKSLTDEGESGGPAF